MCCFFINGTGYSYDSKWVYLGTNKKLFKRNGLNGNEIVNKIEEMNKWDYSITK